ncbi:GNAT family N-acetyltransferase [Falsochrobactrum sp. TDYN1]|uniref:GNAT family N-acetyltransferase n=1 Tax=Falsochrobactrum tianjinense TaxID=2706015 RepID=A0A949PNS0_9HYPH|nr:GNAT family N-acetyltransferase [Falsochrobactrum sp. TDYN1]MBV2144637.1 GNAT family N-acetyltransferase [Falsochrobactrum sp. TDYN1]
MLTIHTLEPRHHAKWEPLWQAYQAFYEVVIPPETTKLTWERFHDSSEPMHALGAFEDSLLVGFVHVIFHRSCWLPQGSCYLQDLYVENSQRGKGTGSALIEAVADLARNQGADRLYWLTQESNTTARRLYDSIAEQSGFIQYRKAL